MQNVSKESYLNVSQYVIEKINFFCIIWSIKWFKSTYGYILFKEFSNDTSHAQIRVKTKKLWPRQVGQSFLSQHRKLCRSIENYVATWFSAAIKKLCHDIENYVARYFSVQHRKLCCDRKNCVVT